MGWRANTGQAQAAQSVSTLLVSLYGAWNGDTTTNELGTSLFGAWNGETSSTVTTLNGSFSSAWNGDSFYSTSGITASNVNNVTLSAGKIGNSFTFNGSNYVSLPASVMNFTGDFTVNFWIKINSTAVSNQGIMGNKRWAMGPGGFEILFIGGWLTALGGNEQNGASGFATNGSLTLSNATTWKMVTFIYRKGVSNSFYIDGSLTNTQAHQHTLLTSSFNGALGKEIQDNYYLNGNLDAVTFWNREITENEILALYNSGNGREYPYPSTISIDVKSPNDNFGTNHGTLMNGCSFGIGKIGNAFTFDGVNDYVSFPTDSWNSLVGTDLTISLWVKFASTGNQTLISNMSAPGVNIWNGWEIRISSGQPIFYSWNNTGNTNGVIGSSVTTNTWYHIVATKRGNSYKIYMNGSLTSTGSGTGNAIVNASFYPNIGHLQYSSSFHANYTTNGTLIDAVNLWNREITADEVTQLYNSGTGAQYPFTGTFSSAINQLGVDNGTLMNGCYLSDGKIGKAFTFDGINDFVQLPNNSLNFTGDFSISLWVYLTAFPGEQTPIGNYYEPSPSAGNSRGWMVYMTGQSLYWIVCGSSQVNLITSISSFQNTWKQITITFKNGVGSKIYFDGSLVTSNSSTITPIYNSTQTPFIGKYQYGNGSSFGYMSSNSKVDGLAVWQKELTQSEITELYNSGNGKQITATPIVQTGLILNLDASRKSSYTGTGTTWTDISGNAKNGTIFNSPIFGTAGDGSFLFNASNQQIRVGSVTSGLTLTYNMWIRLSTISQQMLFWDGSSANGNDFWTVLTTDGKIRTMIDNTTYLTSNSSITANTWYNISIVTTSTGKSIYINGVLDSTDNTPILTRTGYSYLSIGYAFDGSNDVQGWMGGTNLRGNIGSFNIYNRSLSATEVLQNFNATKSRFGY